MIWVRNLSDVKEMPLLPNQTPESWDNLLVLLGNMHDAFQQFLSFLCDEEHQLRAMNQQGVADITEKKEHAIAVMYRYEEQLNVVMHQLAGPTNREQLGRWLRQVRRPQAYKAGTMFDELFGMTQKIQAQGHKNEILIRRMQCVVREAIGLIYKGLGTGPVYQGSGALQFASVPSSVSLQG